MRSRVPDVRLHDQLCLAEKRFFASKNVFLGKKRVFSTKEKTGPSSAARRSVLLVLLATGGRYVPCVRPYWLFVYFVLLVDAVYLAG